MPQSWSIAQAVDRVNRSILLPAIQREFVWDADQIIRLFDSLMQEYPIGAFLVWHLNGEAAQDEMKYQFIQHYIEDSVHPDEPEFEQMRYHNKKIREEDEIDLPSEQDLILDGQQRLTAFYIGLKGTFTEKQKYAQRKNADAWNQKRLYLNLLSGDDETVDDELGLQYEFSFREPDPSNSEGTYWYRVGEVLNIDQSDDVMDIASELDVPDEQRWSAGTTLKKLFDAVHNDDLIQYHEENTTDRERVLDIFIRMNDGGTPLSKSEILLSMATARWGEGEDSVDAREQITSFVDNLNRRHPDKNFKFGIDFILKALLMYGTESIPQYRIGNFSNENLDRMQTVWENGTFQDSIERAIDLIVEFGIDNRSLTSHNALIPISYYIYRHNPSLDWTSQDGLETRKRIHYWLTSALLNGTFNSRPDEVLDDARTAIDEADSGYPLEEIHSRMRGRGKVVGFSAEVLDTLLEETTYRSKKSFLLLSLLHFGDAVREGVEYQQDHIFPQNRLDAEELVKEHEFPRPQAEQLEDACDRVANLQLLTDEENARKQELPFEEWIRTRTDDYRDRHCIPQNDSLYQIENFLQFLDARDQLIRERVVETFQDFTQERTEITQD
ncbi:DUF262 domain-containing protein [Halosimplex halophilum]|uniref:DUF262 domain-containing protein n=1 Tax=Halosimplex halophilum TaxID=2559572 RepID=UPI00107EFD95|nr:DUF262 domain-containing protein [Halosimplex halophilum]